MTRIVLDESLHVTPYGDDELFVRRGSKSTFSKVIRDEGRRGILTYVVRAFLEPRDRDEVTAELAQSLQDRSEDDIGGVIDLLERQEVLRRVPESEPESAAVTIIGTGRVAADLAALLTAEGLACTTVTLNHGAGEDEERLADALEEAGEGAVAVVALDHLRPALSFAANDVAMRLHLDILHLVLDGPELIVGPFVVPGETACYLCYDIGEEGTRQLRHDYIAYKDHLDRHPHQAIVSPAASQLAAAWATLAVKEAVRERRSFLHGRVLRVDLDRVEVVSQRVLQLPRCPACTRVRHEPRHVFL